MITTVLSHLNCLANQERQELYKRFSYESLAPMRWGQDPANRLCSTGRTQSPINFVDKQMLTVQPLITWGTVVGSFANYGHTIQVDVDTASLLTVENTTYTLEQFHVHVPSEHHRASKNFDMEVHFVFRYGVQYAIYGVWFTVADTSCSFITSLLANGVPVDDAIPVTVGVEGLKRLEGGVWSYEGSFTTPPCTEGVIWFVADTPMNVSWVDLKKMKDVMVFNARPTLPVPKRRRGGRTRKQEDLEYNFKDEEVNG